MQLDVEVSPPAFVRDRFKDMGPFIKGIYYWKYEQAITIIACIFYQVTDGQMDEERRERCIVAL